MNYIVKKPAQSTTPIKERFYDWLWSWYFLIDSIISIITLTHYGLYMGTYYTQNRNGFMRWVCPREDRLEFK